jgi:hypothetical protein
MQHIVGMVEDVAGVVGAVANLVGVVANVGEEVIDTYWIYASSLVTATKLLKSVV